MSFLHRRLQKHAVRRIGWLVYWSLIELLFWPGCMAVSRHHVERSCHLSAPQSLWVRCERSAAVVLRFLVTQTGLVSSVC